MYTKVRTWLTLSLIAATTVTAFTSTAAKADPSYRICGPVQIITMKRQAIPRAVGVRRIFLNGNPVTVSGSLVTDYNWSRSSYARVYKK